MCRTPCFNPTISLGIDNPVLIGYKNLLILSFYYLFLINQRYQALSPYLTALPALEIALLVAAPALPA
jgi:hypothetical protein